MLVQLKEIGEHRRTAGTESLATNIAVADAPSMPSHAHSTAYRSEFAGRDEYGFTSEKWSKCR